MNTKYQDFLYNLNIISEEEFNKITESLPDYDTSNINFCDYDCESEDDIAQCIIDNILINYATSMNVNFSNKTFELDNVDNLEDLEQIVKKFQGWTITNYEYVKECLEESINNERNLLISIIRDKASIEKLRNFAFNL